MNIIKFTKMCATGNDFVVVDNRDNVIQDTRSFSKHVCSRRFGIGADGVLLLENSEKADFKMRIITLTALKLKCVAMEHAVLPGLRNS